MKSIGVIGSLVQDEIEFVWRNEIFRQVGGGVYYAGHALIASGYRPTLFPILAEKDRSMLDGADFPKNSVEPVWSAATTMNRCIYPEESLDKRIVKILSKAEGIGWREGFAARELSIISLTPISQNEFAPDFYTDLRKYFKGLIAMDAQGLVRGPRLDFRTLLRSHIDWIKVDEDEARLLTGASSIDQAASEFLSWEISEVVITQGSRGAVIYINGIKIPISPVPVSKIVDATGCGDTFWALYVAQRLEGKSPREAGERGAAAASAKLSLRGPLRRR